MTTYGATESGEERQRAISGSSISGPVFSRQSSVVGHVVDDGSTQTGPNNVSAEPKKRLSKRQLFVVISMSLFYFTVMCAYSMLAPFFPAEAMGKGANLMIVGFIFATFPLVVFLTSPIFGIALTKIGLRLMLLTGLFVEGSTTILFGFLDLMPDGHVFIIFAFLVRIVCGLGSSATSTSSMAIITDNFQGSVATAMGFLETFGGLGLMAGPVIGGALYQAGGFKLPFLVLGGIILISIVPVYMVLPGEREPDPSHSTRKESGCVRPIAAYKNPGILLMALVIAIGGMVIAFLDPTLSVHLAKFSLTKGEIGLMFLAITGVYTVFAPIFGYFADQKDTRVMVSIGCLITALALICLGPSPITRSVMPSTLWLNGISLGLLGFGIAPLLIPTLADMHKSARKAGLPETLETHGVLSGIFNSMFNVGAIIGPTAAGSFSLKIGFAWACTILAGVVFVLGLIVAIFTIAERIRERKNNSDGERLRLIVDA